MKISKFVKVAVVKNDTAAKLGIKDLIIFPVSSADYTRRKMDIYWQFHRQFKDLECSDIEDITIENSGFSLSLVELNNRSSNNLILGNFIHPRSCYGIPSITVKLSHEELNKKLNYNIYIQCDVRYLIGLVKSIGYISGGEIHGKFSIDFNSPDWLEIKPVLETKNDEFIEASRIGELMANNRRVGIKRWIPGNRYFVDATTSFIYIGKLSKFYGNDAYYYRKSKVVGLLANNSLDRMLFKKRLELNNGYLLFKCPDSMVLSRGKINISEVIISEINSIHGIDNCKLWIAKDDKIRGWDDGNYLISDLEEKVTNDMSPYISNIIKDKILSNKSKYLTFMSGTTGKTTQEYEELCNLRGTLISSIPDYHVFSDPDLKNISNIAFKNCIINIFEKHLKEVHSKSWYGRDIDIPIKSTTNPSEFIKTKSSYYLGNIKNLLVGFGLTEKELEDIIRDVLVKYYP